MRRTVGSGPRPSSWESAGSHIDVDIRTDPEGNDLLGQDVLTQFCCEYRFRDQELRLDGPPPAAGAHRIHLGGGGHVYLDLEWPCDGSTASAVFDTGASATVVDTAFAQAHPALFTPIGTSPGTDSSGATFQTPMVEMVGPRLLGHISRQPQQHSSTWSR